MAAQYQTAWDAHAETVIEAFYDVSGLQFCEDTIQAVASYQKPSVAGLHGETMRLSGGEYWPDFKMLNIIHELSHRLLTNNRLGAASLGLYPLQENSDDTSQYISHRLSYPLERAVCKRLGRHWLQLYKEYEQKAKAGSPHAKAYAWVEGLRERQRNTAISRLANYAQPWDKSFDWDIIEPREPEAFFKHLIS